MRKNTLARFCAIITLICTIFVQSFALIPYFFWGDDYFGIMIMAEIVQIGFLIIRTINFTRKCPKCGKRKLVIEARAGGTRYTLYDGECRNCGKKFDITRDREEGTWSFNKTKEEI